ncbi:DUF7534 family protein [Haladaptatus sp. DFWS20]|uniref:DUF7534 family protein n=1 Tax=Haladaptatus sp. DFWS20 TaxID=3403467 RepID=UPI003EC1171C
MVSVERAVVTLKYGILLAFTLGAMVSPPDPFTQLIFTPVLLVVSVPLVYLILERDPERNRNIAFVVVTMLLAIGGLRVAELLTGETLGIYVRLAWVATTLPVVAWAVYFRESGRGLEEIGA